jgi:hypothetical protein
MAKDLIAKRQLLGLTRAGVVQLLGAPTSRKTSQYVGAPALREALGLADDASVPDTFDEYDLGADWPWPVNDRWLVLVYSPDGRVTGAAVVPGFPTGEV